MLAPHTLRENTPATFKPMNVYNKNMYIILLNFTIEEFLMYLNKYLYHWIYYQIHQ